MQKAMIIINSKNKRSQFAQKLFDICRVLAKKDYEIIVKFTKRVNDSFNIVLKYHDKIDLLVIAGGDGTMNEVVNALKETKNKPKIMYFPTGTVNDFGTSLKIPNNFNKQMQLLKKHETKFVDSGKVNDYYFNYICAFGPFTRTSYVTPHDEKNKYGKFAYYRHLVAELPSFSQAYPLDIIVDGEHISGTYTYALIINSTSVAGFKHFMKHDSIDDGYFNLVLVSKANAKIFRKGIGHLIEGMKDDFNDEDYILKKFKKLEITTNSDVQWTLDGEKGPTGSIKVEVIHHNLEIMS
ncbi:YegS/Rv2252/BmrU family lipid kinase [Erysipelotrichaceae bacterium OttesenSCG-928-M19]|nr:YegS/Rv2252/BmrU family lipid kinase [Erysipelotrichaceae bacterium OttesenSCG-928-M19]